MANDPDFDKTTYIMDGLFLLASALLLSLLLYKC